MIPVVPGADAEKLQRRIAFETISILSGTGGRIIPLNGGSETRRDAIEYWRDYARRLNVGCEVRGNCLIIIGGRRP